MVGEEKIMAWEDFERNGAKGMSGDRPIDEFTFALQRIATAYEERYSRKPFVNELLYAFLEAQRQKRWWEPLQPVMYQTQKG